MSLVYQRNCRRVFGGWPTGHPVPGLTAVYLGPKELRREFGKVGTQSDLHLHDFTVGDTEVTVLVPDRYPDRLAPLSLALTGAQTGVLVIDELNASAGEMILSLDAAGLAHGALVLRNYLQPEQITPLLAGTHLEHWKIWTDEDWPAVRNHLAAAPYLQRDGFVAVPIDHHFNVKGVGAVVLGVVRQGTLTKGDTLYAWPDKLICPIRSIQVHDKDRGEAITGDRVGLALRNTDPDKLDRGMVLAPADAAVVVKKTGDTISGTLKRNPHNKFQLVDGSVVHMGIGMQYVPIRVTSAPGPGVAGEFVGTLEKPLVHLPGDGGIIWHMDSPIKAMGNFKLA